MNEAAKSARRHALERPSRGRRWACPLPVGQTSLGPTGHDRDGRRSGRGGDLRGRLEQGRGCLRRRRGGLGGSRTRSCGRDLWSRDRWSDGSSWGRRGGAPGRSGGLTYSSGGGMRLWRTRDQRSVRQLPPPTSWGCGWCSALSHAYPNGALQRFIFVSLRQRGGTEAETRRPGQQREYPPHRGRRPSDRHASWIGGKRKTRV